MRERDRADSLMKQRSPPDIENVSNIVDILCGHVGYRGSETLKLPAEHESSGRGYTEPALVMSIIILRSCPYRVVLKLPQ